MLDDLNYAKVTVYITNYNYGLYIRKAIDSVLSQTLTDWELIIIDDGSSDNSREIIEEYVDAPNIQIVYQQNKGLNITNNVALRLSSGKYIMRLDADDYIHPEALETLSSRLEKDNDLGLVFPDYYLVDKDGNVLSEERRHNFDNEVRLFDQAAHGACTMIRTDFLREVGGYNESYNCQDGYELWVKFTQKYKVSNVNQPLFYYRQHGSNLTGNENRILDTRASINANFVEEFGHNNGTLIIIPVRGGIQDIGLRSLNGKTLLEHKIEQAILAKNGKKIVISSPNEKVKELIPKTYLKNGKVLFHHRVSSQARANVSLAGTMKDIIELDELQDVEYKHILLLTVEYPFLKPHKIDDAVNTLVLFGSDSLISVRPDHAIFYQHHGDGMHAIMNRDRYTKLEREALFKQVGGISVVKKEALLNITEYLLEPLVIW
jgi:glycosyltransferase involved in cell wall biosynthesis